ncbi:MAG TPA: cupin domain-containing protein [Thermoleophilaceae bacterium]|nr:cupin domain-containing protein [Thermoleophilaceae bacterium]
MSYSIKNLQEVEDSAAKHGFSDTQEARFPREDLDAESTGLAYIVLRPGKQQPFAHRHERAEEIYVVLSGSGRLKLDDEIIEVGPMDAIRMAPQVARALEAGDEGLEVLAFGPRHAGDAEMVKDFWDQQ